MKNLSLILLLSLSRLSGSELGNLAAGLKAGEWAELTGTQRLTKSFLETSGFNTGSFSILQYSDKAVWDPLSKQFLFAGSPHDNPHKYAMFSSDSNAWRLGPLPLSCMNEGSITGCGFGSHGYQHNAIDPVRGDHYLRVRGRQIYRYNTGLSRWFPTPLVPDSVITYPTVAAALEYFPEAGGLLYVNGGDKRVAFYRASTMKWSLLKSNVAMFDYHNVAQYNPVHKVVVFGGGNGSTDLYKIDSQLTITPIAKPPQAVAVNSSIFTVDPAGGKYLAFFGGSDFYEYDVPSDRWSRIAQAPAWGTVFFDIVAAPVINHGIVMFLKYADPPRVFLYKHSTGIGVESAAVRPVGAALSVSPNPVAGSRALLTVASRAGSIVRMALYDARGRQIAQWRGQGTHILDSRMLAAGVYVLKARSGRQIFSKHLTVLK